MKRLVCLAVATGCLAVGLAATGEAAGAGGAAGKPERGDKEPAAVLPVEEITVAGVVARTLTAGREGKPGRAVYTLTDSEGRTIKLGLPKPGRDGTPPVDLDPYVGSKVRMIAMGTVHEKDGTKLITIRSVKSVEKTE